MVKELLASVSVAKTKRRRVPSLCEAGGMTTKAYTRTGQHAMSTIDKQRIAAVRKLELLGYTFADDDWMHPTNDAAPVPAITDALHALLVKRADDLEGCPEGSDEERELEAITNAIEAYDAVRWPTGKIAGGKG